MTQRETSADYRKYDSESVEIVESDDIRGGQYTIFLTKKKNGKTLGAYIGDSDGVPVKRGMNMKILIEIIRQKKLSGISLVYETGVKSKGKPRHTHPIARDVVGALRKKAE